VPIRAVLSEYLLSPVILVVAVLIGLLIERRCRRSGRLLAWSGVVMLLLLAMPVIGTSMLIALEQNLPLTPPPNAPPQAIVILGGDIMRHGAAIEPSQPGLASLERLRAGAALSRRTGLPVLISGGPIYDGERPLAALMADSMQHDFQVPVRWTEPASRDTWENAQFSAAILHGQGINSVYVVTHPWHMRRAIMAFARAGITVTAAPTRLDHLPQPLLAAIAPNARAWRDSFYALHEWIGCVFYAMR
jgi:uncharacterized SAM-binding protein YcdF (DUF218 family)